MRLTPVCIAAALAIAGNRPASGGRPNDGLLPLRGHVVVEDGSMPPAGIRVSTSCGNIAAARDGTFTFTSGFNLAGNRRCDLEVSLAGFRTCRGFLPHKDNVQVMLQRIGAEGSIARTADVRLMKCVARLGQTYGEAEAAMGLWQWSKAEGWLRRTVEICPEHAPGWDELGLALEMQGRRDEARISYQEAAEVNPGLTRPLVHLAGLALADGRYQEAYQLAERALRLGPAGMPRAWFYHSAAAFHTGRFGAAEASARRTLREDPQHAFPRAEFLLGSLLARKGDTAAAAVHLQNFLQFAGDGADVPQARRLLEALARKPSRKQ